MIPARFPFEGQMLTITEIRKVVPCLSRGCVVSHLEAGRNTKKAMLEFDTNAARRRGGKHGSVKAGRAKFTIGRGQ